MNTMLALAEAALQQYRIEVASIHFIGQSASQVFKIVDTRNNSYSLRIHAAKSETMDSDWTSPETLRSEMIWLEALSAGTDLTAPVPCRNHHGELVTDVDGMKCTLIKWLEGEQQQFITTVEDAGRIGQMIGKLHQRAFSWTVPEQFARPVYDGKRIGQALDKLHHWGKAGQIERENAELLTVAGQRVMNMMNTLDTTPNYWGIIHADLIPSNFIFYNQECRPIDFGACGFGYFLFDLGWTFSYIHPAFREQLLKSYSGYFMLPPNYIELLEGFFVAAQLETMNFWIGLPDAKDWLPEHIQRLASKEFKHYVNKEQFLFTCTPYWE